MDIVNKLNNLRGIAATKGNYFKLYYVTLYGEKLLSFKKCEDQFLVFPYHKQFSSTKEIILNEYELLELVKSKFVLEAVK